MKLMFFQFFLVFNLFAGNDCQITLPDKIVYQKNAHLNNFNNIYEDFKNTNCPHDVLKFTIDSLIQQNGIINTRHFTTLLNDEFPEKNISIYPEEITMVDFSTFIKEKLQLNEDFEIQNLKFISNKQILKLQKFDDILVECQKCNNAGDKNVKITLNGQNSWVSLKLLSKIQVYMANADISPNDQTPLTEKIIPEMIYVDNPTQFITTNEDLRYFKTNKRIQKNSAIKTTDLLPITLVTSGQLTKIQYDNNGIRVNGNAIAKKSGSKGQTIELYNPKNKKLILGKIIDFNTVKIEL